MKALPDYPMKKLYATFEGYAKNYRFHEYHEDKQAFGYYCNPEARWDWFVIGGRWPVTFLVKDTCTEYSLGERTWGDENTVYTVPEGYMWVSAARKKDIEWEAMRNWQLHQIKQQSGEEGFDEVFDGMHYNVCDADGNECVYETFCPSKIWLNPVLYKAMSLPLQVSGNIDDAELLFRAQTRRKGEKVWMDGSPVASNWVQGGVALGKGSFSIVYTSLPLIPVSHPQRYAP